ncbi:DNA-directed RNA polymerase subunit delta [Bacillus sp. S/N-304-OC-R1]|uniref:DNA-directed RNA polymerase subunit delta n=1 Tax=Bacillus sp. S/N-304-OC-R1 TaxID=2758034 RepID=UPI001C8E72EE|nr:DNA-directed RNA polymerase subunit delta [Bacillus sp. S/N-304-OC-R1]MBY0123275.1 DNA-directed RNA polymerase subunit delta [Bacillus sp. S/N-304-OC-R1]
MSLYELSKEELQEMSFIEVAYELLKGKKEALAFQDIMDELTTLLDLTEDQVRAKIAQFYTDLNIDGRFLGLGDNKWGLRVWYPIEQQEEDVVTEIKPKKKKAKKAADDELDEYDELDDEDIDYDDLDDLEDEFEEDEELLEEDDELLDDEDLEDEDDDLIESDEEYDLGDEDEEIEDDDMDIEEEDLD